jgi:hypothetical protein
LNEVLVVVVPVYGGEVWSVLCLGVVIAWWRVGSYVGCVYGWFEYIRVICVLWVASILQVLRYVDQSYGCAVPVNRMS